MHKKIIGFIVICFFTVEALAQTKNFIGTWFNIDYPASFAPKGSLRNAYDQTYESAFFISPDNQVEFYVFAANWRQNPKDITLLATEKSGQPEMKESKSQIVKWWTISANDGSYTRSYQETRTKNQDIYWIIGIKYKNQSAYNKYKKNYLQFKSSFSRNEQN